MNNLWRCRDVCENCRLPGESTVGSAQVLLNHRNTRPRQVHNTVIALVQSTVVYGIINVVSPVLRLLMVRKSLHLSFGGIAYQLLLGLHTCLV